MSGYTRNGTRIPNYGNANSSMGDILGTGANYPNPDSFHKNNKYDTEFRTNNSFYGSDNQNRYQANGVHRVATPSRPFSGVGRDIIGGPLSPSHQDNNNNNQNNNNVFVNQNIPPEQMHPPLIPPPSAGNGAFNGRQQSYRPITGGLQNPITGEPYSSSTAAGRGQTPHLHNHAAFNNNNGILNNDLSNNNMNMNPSNSRGGTPGPDGRQTPYSASYALPPNHLPREIMPWRPLDTRQAVNATMELDHAIGFNGRILDSLHFHPDQQHYVHVAGGTVVIADLAHTHKQQFLRGHDDVITCLSLSPSGKYIASGQKGKNADVIVWDFETGQIVFRLQEHVHGISCMSFSDDERLLATVGDHEDGKLFIWDLKTGQIVASTSVLPTTRIAFGAFVKDVKRRFTSKYQFVTAVGDVDQKVLLYALDPMTGKFEVEKFNTGSYSRTYTCLTWSSDFELIFAGSTTGDVSIFQVRSRSLVKTIGPFSGGVLSIACSPQDDMYIGCGDGSCCFYTHNGWEYIDTRRVSLHGDITCMSIHTDGKEMLCGTLPGNIYRMRLRDMAPTLLSEAHSGPVNSVGFPVAGVSERAATCSADGTIRLWDLTNYQVEVRCRGPSVCTSVAVGDDVIVTGWQDGFIRAYAALSGKQLWEIQDAHKGGVTALLLSHNQKFIVSGGEQGEVRIWEIRSRELICHLKQHTQRITDLALFADNRHLLSCSRDRSFLCWDLQQQKRITSHYQRMGGISSMCIIQDHNLILTVGQERRICFWDLGDSKPIDYIDYPSGEPTCIAVSRKGDVFATAGTDQRVMLWDAKTKKLLAEGVGHSSTITKLAFSPDDKQLISIGDDHNIFVWNIYRL